MHQCTCGGLYGSCGHRAPTLRRDAANTFRSVASADPKFTGIFWGVIAAMTVLGGIGSALSKIPHQAWPAIGISAGMVAFFVIAAIISKAREGRRNGRGRVKVDTRIY